MQKLVTVNTFLTPAGKVAFAEEILGIRVSDPSTRFNPGTLAGRITSALEAAAVILLSPGKLIAVDCSGVAGNVSSLLASVATNNLGVMFDASVDVGSGRSRALVVDSIVVSSVNPPSLSGVDISADQALCEALLLPDMPSWTAAGALSAIYDELQGRETPSPFVAILDQFTGRIVVHRYAGNATADSGVTDAAALPQAGVIQAAFDLSDPAAPPAGVAGPVWG